MEGKPSHPNLNGPNRGPPTRTIRVFFQQSGGAFRLEAVASTLGDADRSLAFAKQFWACMEIKDYWRPIPPFTTFSR
jgi:hypothetical protein